MRFLGYLFAVIALFAVIVHADPPTTSSDRDSIVSEMKSDQEAIKSISAEIVQDEKDAADAEALATTPPTNVKAEDRDAYIDARKNDAQTAHDAAKDARDRLEEAKKSLADATARLKAAGGDAATSQPAIK
jgi:hypothetical protein